MVSHALFANTYSISRCSRLSPSIWVNEHAASTGKSSVMHPTKGSPLLARSKEGAAFTDSSFQYAPLERLACVL